MNMGLFEHLLTYQAAATSITDIVHLLKSATDLVVVTAIGLICRRAQSHVAM